MRMQLLPDVAAVEHTLQRASHHQQEAEAVGVDDAETNAAPGQRKAEEEVEEYEYYEDEDEDKAVGRVVEEVEEVEAMEQEEASMEAEEQVQGEEQEEESVPVRGVCVWADGQRHDAHSMMCSAPLLQWLLRVRAPGCPAGGA